MRLISRPCQRPNGPVQIDWSQSISQGLIAYFPTVAGDVVAGLRTTKSGTADVIVSPCSQGGMSNTYGGATAGARQIAAPQPLLDLPTTYAMSVGVWALASAHLTDRAVVAWGGTDDLLLYPFDSNRNGPRLFWRHVGGSIINTEAPADSRWHHFVFVTAASNNHRLYFDGVLLGQSTASGSVGPFSSISLLGWTDGNQAFHGYAHSWSFHNRALSPAEIQSLYTDPWSLYWAKTRTYFDVGTEAVVSSPFYLRRPMRRLRLR